LSVRAVWFTSLIRMILENTEVIPISNGKHGHDAYAMTSQNQSRTLTLKNS